MGERGYIVLNSLLVIKLVYYKIINKFRIIYVENDKIYITKLQKLILSKWITLTCTFYETRSSSKIYNLLNSIHWLSSNERIHSNKQKIPFVLSSYCFQSVRPSRRRASLTTYPLSGRTKGMYPLYEEQAPTMSVHGRVLTYRHVDTFPYPSRRCRRPTINKLLQLLSSSKG